MTYKFVPKGKFVYEEKHPVYYCYIIIHGQVTLSKNVVKTKIVDSII